MDILEGCKLGHRELKDRAAVEARAILRKYDLSVFPPCFKEGLELALFRGYDRGPRRRPEFLLPAAGHRSIFSLKDLKSGSFKRLANFALDKYNGRRKEPWVLEEVISFAYCTSFRGIDYFVYFGARKNSSEDLDPFHANIFRYPDDRLEVQCVKLLRKTRKRKRRNEVDRLGSSYDRGEQLDDSIFRKTRKRTYRKQEDSNVIISFRNTEENKIASSDEKDKLHQAPAQ